jgi:hypothetical protein
MRQNISANHRPSEPMWKLCPYCLIYTSDKTDHDCVNYHGHHGQCPQLNRMNIWSIVNWFFPNYIGWCFPLRVGDGFACGAFQRE